MKANTFYQRKLNRIDKMIENRENIIKIYIQECLKLNETIRRQHFIKADLYSARSSNKFKEMESKKVSK